MECQSTNAGIHVLQGRSSVGRAAVAKTARGGSSPSAPARLRCKFSRPTRFGRPKEKRLTYTLRDIRDLTSRHFMTKASTCRRSRQLPTQGVRLNTTEGP